MFRLFIKSKNPLAKSPNQESSQNLRLGSALMARCIILKDYYIAYLDAVVLRLEAGILFIILALTPLVTADSWTYIPL